jgi:glycosyltransferase involved in cell wall biosynthesis
MKKPTTTLIITTYNRKDALELVLLSAFNQSVLPNEIIVADDGSRDDTAALVKEFRKKSPVPLLHCWHEDKGFRVSVIRNRAIAMASSHYIIITDGDMIINRHFVKSHVRYAKPKRLIQGSRVFINEQATVSVLANKQITFNFFSKGIKNRYNTLYAPFITPFISYKTEDLTRVRACNQSFWRVDAITINGFNEDFEGWGREDTEFIVRMLNNGIHFYKLKWAVFGYHLHHPKSSRAQVDKHRHILEDTIRLKSKRCVNGIDKYLTA